MALADTLNMVAGLLPAQEAEFRIYLEKSGVMQLIGNVLSYAYKEQTVVKPANLLE
ncbi:hypothetical protein RvY_00383 [Ramazzottius varieornatus]|uniref:Uncharacterized protein n=1 Tax=Ramazzottius varieornatus TaxID=947166 RepID=A0A1D1UMI4_RAMVA|nr:hypothetical protein RvY_00383 [Ramazzottius varieornatus]